MRVRSPFSADSEQPGRDNSRDSSGDIRKACKSQSRLYLGFSRGEVAEWLKAAVCEGCQAWKTGLKSSIVGPLVVRRASSWCWLPDDGPRLRLGTLVGTFSVTPMSRK